MSCDKRERALVLIDAENASPEVAAHALWEAQGLAAQVEARAYGRPSALEQWHETCQGLGIAEVACPEGAPGKNSTDIRIVVDAMDALVPGRADALCVVSDDTDFCHLARRAREGGAEAVLMHARRASPLAQGAFSRCVRLLPQGAFEAALSIMGDRRPDDLWASCSRIATAMGAGRIGSGAGAADEAARVVRDAVVNAGGAAARARIEAALKRNGLTVASSGKQSLADLVASVDGLQWCGDGARLAEGRPGPAAASAAPPSKPQAAHTAVPARPVKKAAPRTTSLVTAELKRAGGSLRVDRLATELGKSGLSCKALGFKGMRDLLDSVPGVKVSGSGNDAIARLQNPRPKAPADPAAAAVARILGSKGPMRVTQLGTELKHAGVDYRSAGHKKLSDLVAQVPGAVLSGDPANRTVSLKAS